MRLALLNLITTPAAILNSAGLELRMGLSSEDPMVGRHVSEPYEVYLTVYTPGGAFRKRLHLGRIPPHRRRLFEVSSLVREFDFRDDHLVVLHRIPARLIERYGTVEEPVELPDPVDYHLFRSYVQYSYPDGGGAHGGVIYEIPPRYNDTRLGSPPSTVLTFTTKIVLSNTVRTSVILLNTSTVREYETTADYSFGLYTSHGTPAYMGRCVVPPFTVRTLEIGELIPRQATEMPHRPEHGSSNYSFYGICENASLLVLVLNLAPALRGVSVEHTHPPQGYLMPFYFEDRQRIKQAAIDRWRTLLSGRLCEP